MILQFIVHLLFDIVDFVLITLFFFWVQMSHGGNTIQSNERELNLRPNVLVNLNFNHLTKISSVITLPVLNSWSNNLEYISTKLNLLV